MNRHRLGALGAAALALTLGGAAVPALADNDSGRPAPPVTDAVSKRQPATPATTAGNAGGFPDATATAAPSLFVPTTPYRMYDSRNDPSPWVPGEYGDIDALTDVDLVPQIPSNATAVAFNVTIVSYAGAGFVQILTPGGVMGESSTANFTGPNLVVANGGSVGLVGGKLQVVVGGTPGAEVDVIIDVAGYYVAPT
jgi:hypothetical protein